MKKFLKILSKNARSAIKIAKPLSKKIWIIGVDKTKKFYKWFRGLEFQHQALLFLIAVFIIGAAGLFLSLSQNEPQLTVEDYPTEWERDITVICTDSEITPADISLRGGEFVKFFFKNQSTKPTSFGIRGKDSGHINSTISIAPNTIASFAWRVPATLKDKKLTSYCRSGEAELTGEIQFTKLER